MSVYVDNLFQVWPPNPQWRYPQACHLWADSLDELHAFAAKLQLRRAWFQNRQDFPHYDLTSNKRALAVRNGAIEMSLKAWIIRQRP